MCRGNRGRPQKRFRISARGRFGGHVTTGEFGRGIGQVRREQPRDGTPVPMEAQHPSPIGPIGPLEIQRAGTETLNSLATKAQFHSGHIGTGNAFLQRLGVDTGPGSGTLPNEIPVAEMPESPGPLGTVQGLPQAGMLGTGNSPRKGWSREGELENQVNTGWTPEGRMGENLPNDGQGNLKPRVYLSLTPQLNSIGPKEHPEIGRASCRERV